MDRRIVWMSTVVSLMVGTAWVPSRGQAPARGGARQIPQFGNQDVRVYKSVMAPGQAWPLHRHNHPRVIVALAGGEVKFVGKSGETTTQRFETGKAYWLAADPAGTYHSEENAGKTPIELMVTELERAH